MEVVIAVGLFAVAVAVMLALLPALTRQNTDTSDALVAQRLPDALRIELRRVAGSDFNAFAAAIPVMTAPLTNGLALVAARDGNRLHTVSYQPLAAGASIPPGEQYFFVETWRFNQPPLAYDSAASVLVVYVRVSWPCYNPGAVAPTALADRDQFTFLVSINR